MIDPIKPIGGFIENTIRPLLEEFRWFFKECKKRRIKITEENISRVISYATKAHFRTVIIQLIQNVVITIIVCATWIISR